MPTPTVAVIRNRLAAVTIGRFHRLSVIGSVIGCQRHCIAGGDQPFDGNRVADDADWVRERGTIDVDRSSVGCVADRDQVEAVGQEPELRVVEVQGARYRRPSRSMCQLCEGSQSPAYPCRKSEPLNVDVGGRAMETIAATEAAIEPPTVPATKSYTRTLPRESEPLPSFNGSPRLATRLPSALRATVETPLSSPAASPSMSPAYLHPGRAVPVVQTNMACISNPVPGISTRTDRHAVSIRAEGHRNGHCDHLAASPSMSPPT